MHFLRFYLGLELFYWVLPCFSTVDVDGRKGSHKSYQLLLKHWDFHCRVLALYLTEEFLEGVLFWVSVPLINLFYVKNKIGLQFIHKLLKENRIFLELFASDGIKHVAKSNKYPISI